jgi:hypothetical protein
MDAQQVPTILIQPRVDEGYEPQAAVLPADRVTGEPKAGSGAPDHLPSVVIGTLTGFDARGVPLVTGPFDARHGPWPARSLVALASSDVGRAVALMFEGGDPAKPLVIGLVQEPQPRSAGPVQAASPSPVEVEIDGEKLVLTASRELVLRCGQASFVLTRAGKILIRGTYVLNRSTGVNRIQGGVVHIN